MKIISWNLWAENKNQCQSVDELIEKFNPDIVCLQEVSLVCLEYLKRLPEYDLVQAQDFISYKKSIKKEYSLVILSKLKILNKDAENKFTVAHLTRRSIWDILIRMQESLEFQYVDVKYKDQIHRIFNIHLEVAAGPKLRLSQFLATIDKFDKKALNIVCGDLNIFACLWLNLIIGWAFGYRLNEIFTNERKLFEREFRKFGLKNIFKGQKTYPKYHLQLDHILIPEAIIAKETRILNTVNISDHLAIMAEI